MSKNVIMNAAEDIIDILVNTEGLGAKERNNLVEFINLLTEFAIMKIYNKEKDESKHLNPADFFGIDKEHIDGKNNSQR